MPTDKYSAVWVSHSSMKDFLTCPRAYYLNNVYKDPKTNHKITLMSPPLALGQAVHDVVESLSVIPTSQRFKEPLEDKFERSWQNVAGKKGGFYDAETEEKYKQRGLAMIRRVQTHPGPLRNLAIKINMDLPHYWLSEDDGIILCGKIDWLEYLKEEDSVHIIDFKTGKKEEDGESLQLPIYTLLVHNCQKRNALKASYWYLESSDELTPVALPDIIESYQKVLEVAKRVKLARQLKKYTCSNGQDMCRACRPLEQIIRGEAEFVGENDFRQDVYILPRKQEMEQDSMIL